MKFIITYIFLIITFSGGCFLSGCEGTTGPTADNFEMSYSSTTDTVLTDADNVLELDTVKILLKDIKLNLSSSNDSNNFKVGPYVLFLRLNSSITSVGTEIIPNGTYDKIKFEVHKLEDTEAIPDPEFADSEGRYSVVCKGRYNYTVFTYKSSKSAKQILQFTSGLVISKTMTNVTLLAKPKIWFIKNNDYMNPRDTVNWNDIDNNIKNNINNNFRIFKDNYKNGIPD
jgi:hypothetical protein